MDGGLDLLTAVVEVGGLEDAAAAIRELDERRAAAIASEVRWKWAWLTAR